MVGKIELRYHLDMNGLPIMNDELDELSGHFRSDLKEPLDGPGMDAPQVNEWNEWPCFSPTNPILLRHPTLVFQSVF